MIDAGSTGLCILANFSEQFVLSDAERDVLTRAILAHVAGRVPVIVTTTHYATQICIAQPPGRTARCRHGDGDAALSRRHLPRVRRAGRGLLPAPVGRHQHPDHGAGRAGGRHADVRPFLARMAQNIANLKYFKLEMPGAASKMRELIRLSGAAIEGPGTAKKPSPCWPTWTPAPPAP